VTALAIFSEKEFGNKNLLQESSGRGFFEAFEFSEDLQNICTPTSPYRQGIGCRKDLVVAN
jgi:hypothetical protein